MISENSQEVDEEDAMAEDVKPEGMVRVRSERPKKAPYACPHTDKPYYAKVTNTCAMPIEARC